MTNGTQPAADIEVYTEYGVFITGASSRESLLDEIERGVLPNVVAGSGCATAEKPPFLSVTLRCGQRRDYQTRDDVPRETVECRCGKVPYPHYFIAYQPS